MALRRWGLRILVGVTVLAALGAAGIAVWGSTPLGPTERAVAALQSDDAVLVSANDWITFEPAQSAPSMGLIFYPGARVDPRSYAPLTRAIAADGVLVVVVPMPLNFAIFAPNRADAVLIAYPSISTWAIAGHSLGGAMAARYAYQHVDAVDGLVLWASYPPSTDDLTNRDDLVGLSIYATLDGLTDDAEITASRQLMPSRTCWTEIVGGNHAQFGDYGAQGGDSAATISADDQQAQIVSATTGFLSLLNQMEMGGEFNCTLIGGLE